MTEEEFNQCIETFFKYNPEILEMSREDYNVCLRNMLLGDKQAEKQIKNYIFFRASEWLLKDYIENEKKAQDFEDEIHDAFDYATSAKPEVLSYSAFKNSLKKDISSFFEAKRKNALNKNMDLNYENVENIAEVPCKIDYEERALGNYSKQQIENLMNGIEDTGLNNGKEQKPERNREIFLRYLGLDGDDRTFSEIGEEYGFTGSYIRQVCVNHRHYIKRCLRASDLKEEHYECAGMPITNKEVKLGRYIKEIMREQ